MRIAEVKSVVSGSAHFVGVVAEDGTTGFGQSACWAYPLAVHSVVESFRPYLIGVDARHIEHHWHHLYRMGPFRGSVLMGAVSAIDIALWDLKGKLLGAPVWDLLGGQCRNKVRLHLLLPGTNAEDLVAQATQAVNDGFTAVKFDPLPVDYCDLSLEALAQRTGETVAEVRAAVGPNVDLLLELHRKLTAMQAPTIIESLAFARPLMVEDPLQIDSIQVTAEIARGTRVPMANGERLHSIWEFRELLAAGGSQFVRPDLGLAGGLTGVRKIAAIAEAHHASVVTHNCLGPLLTAASIHLDLSIPNVVTQEYSRIDEEINGGAIRSSFARQGGWIHANDQAGLGVEVDLHDIEPVDLVGRPIHEIATRQDGSVAFSV